MNISSIGNLAFDNRRVVIVLLLVVTGFFAVGASTIDETTELDAFQTESDESDALAYIQQNFSVEDNTTSMQLVVQDEDVLDHATMDEVLAFQQDLKANETVNGTLADEDPFTSVANLIAKSELQREHAAEIDAKHADIVATEQALGSALDQVQDDPETAPAVAFEQANEASPLNLTDRHRERFTEAAQTVQTAEDDATLESAYQHGTSGVLQAEYESLEDRRAQLEEEQSPSLTDQRAQLATMSNDDIERAVDSLFEAENRELLALMPDGYQPGDASSHASVVAIRQDTGGEFVGPDVAPQSIIDAQLVVRSMAADRGAADYVVFGNGISAHEFDASMEDSLSIIGPLALGFVLTVLLIAYRDPLDVALGLFGILAVLTWTFGFMGWTGIEFGQIFIAVPVLLIGLSIDYAIHVVMRGREARAGTEKDVDSAIRAGLVGVGFALILVTVTTAAGFLSNLVSPMTPIQEFGLVNAVGITAALFVFGLLVPALKIELDSFLESKGVDRRKAPVGTNGRLEPLLRTGERIARTAPIVLLVVVLLISAGGAYGGTQVDTSFTTEQFIAEEPPSVTENLPASLEPADYTVRESMDYLDEHFVRQDLQSQVLVIGDPTDPETLSRIAAGEAAAANASSTHTLGTGDAAIQGPISTMEQVAAINESFNETFTEADTTGDGIPDQDLAQVFDELFAIDDTAASSVIHRTDDGSYAAVRIVTFADGAATRGDITTDSRAVAAQIDDDEVTAIATGEQTILYYMISEEIFDTVVQSLLVTLLGVGLFLVVASRVATGSATLGIVTVIPVLLALSWILGTMYLLDIPFNSITGMITSLTIGLGVAYSIHVSQRYQQQRIQGASVWDALNTTVTGTGGALLGSATTTAGGFGVLTLSFMPALQQFGLITALSIVYAFLASVLVLPTLLVLWSRLLGPEPTDAQEKQSTLQGTQPQAED